MNKIVLVVIILLSLIPIIGYADDSDIFDVSESFTHSVKMDDYSYEFGGEIEYIVTIYNNSSHGMIYRGINTNFGYVDDDDLGEYNGDIMPGKAISVKIKQIGRASCRERV